MKVVFRRIYPLECFTVSLTTNRYSVALKNAHGMSKDEVAKDLVNNTNGAGQKCLSNISESQIDQNPVKRMAELLELCCGHQHQAIGECGSDDHNDHPQCRNVVHPSRCNMVVRSLKWIWKKENRKNMASC